MRETVLLFNIKDKKRAQELQMICMSLRIRVRLIKKEEYFQTVGVLAGMKGMTRIDYKAGLTDTNSQWTVPELFKELEKEHAAMHQL